MPDAKIKNKKILIIEDEIPTLRVLARAFKEENFIVLEAKNGKEGLEIALKNHPDLILLDIIMPVMDGVAMLKKLREDTWGKDVKVITLTNLNSNEKVAELIGLGSYEYLVKTDWKLKGVVAKIREQLRN